MSSIATIEEFNLKKYEDTKLELEKKAQEYKSLTINGIEDKEGLEAVRKARIELKNDRIGVEKFFKMAKDFLNQKKSEVLEAEKDVLLLIEPIEKELHQKEKEIEEEKARIKKEKEDAQMKLVQDRFDKLMTVRFSGNIPFIEMSTKSEEEFQAIYDSAKIAFDIAETERIAEEALKLKEKEEADKRLAEIEAKEKQQKAEQEKIDNERRKIEAERAKIERAKKDEKIRKEAEENGRKKAEQEAESARIKKEKEAEEQQKRLEKETHYKAWLTKYAWQYDRIIKEDTRIVLIKEVSEFII